MTSLPERDPKADTLVASGNAAVIFIDYQAPQIAVVKSRDRTELVANTVRTAQLARLFGLPVILSTVNVADGAPPTVAELADALPGVAPIDRTSINAWEDEDFIRAVKATGRKKIVIGALWTEACLAFPTIDMLAEGYEVYPVLDAVGGTSREAHDTAVERIVRAGAKPLTWVALGCELQRDWNRVATADAFADILSAAR
ncbi:MAG TPA: hydrolase [Rhizomicrobium sp.]|nr:hydrolase [Rhizomicrobium sp.]